MTLVQDRWRTVYHATRILFAISCAAVFSIQSIREHPRAVLGLVGFLFLSVPMLVKRLLRMNLGYKVKTLTFVFIFLAYNLGVVMDWYHELAYFDDLAHALSGVLFTLVGLCIFVRLDDGLPELMRNWRARLAFAFCLSLAVAVVWELYEFLGYLATGQDMQHHETTGVFDTMRDMINCLIGSLVMAIDHLYCIKKGKRTFLLDCYEEYVELNPKA